jgi:hypothetical protein
MIANKTCTTQISLQAYTLVYKERKVRVTTGIQNPTGRENNKSADPIDKQKL